MVEHSQCPTHAQDERGRTRGRRENSVSNLRNSPGNSDIDVLFDKNNSKLSLYFKFDFYFGNQIKLDFYVDKVTRLLLLLYYLSYYYMNFQLEIPYLSSLQSLFDPQILLNSTFTLLSRPPRGVPPSSPASGRHFRRSTTSDTNVSGPGHIQNLDRESGPDPLQIWGASRAFETTPGSVG